MQLGSLLKGRDQQYVALRDDKGAWRILDTFNTALETIDTEEEIPDDSPAVTIVTEGAFLSLVKEAARLGIIQKMVTSSNMDGVSENSFKCELDEAQKKILDLEVKLQQEPKSEAFLIKSRVVDALLKLSAMSDVSEIKS